MPPSPHHLYLTEYAPTLFSPSELPWEVASYLWHNYGDKITVTFPSPQTDDQWQLVSQGWIGAIPLPGEHHLTIQPKLPLANLFRMWQYAYDLRAIHWLDGLTSVDTLPEFYEQLAQLLAQRVLRRARLGLHCAYQERREPLPFVRGRLLPAATIHRPGKAALHCRYQAQTAVIADNQILAYTLARIGRSGLCREPVQQTVRRAYHAVAGVAPPRPFTAADCHGRFYTRLNQDYQPLHALCRFFLEHTGPHQPGNRHAGAKRQMIPFLVDVARLYEQFVAAWLQTHLPPPWHIRAQESVSVGRENELRFHIDLVLYDGNGRPHAVLDTKYKQDPRPKTADFNQIVTYAKIRGCRQAVLIYPVSLTPPLDVTVGGDLHVRALTFSLDADLDRAGRQFLDHLLPSP